MKTAMEQAIEKMAKYSWGHYDPISILKEFTEIEKNQLHQSFNKGAEYGHDCFASIEDGKGILSQNFEEYYASNFKK